MLGLYIGSGIIGVAAILMLLSILLTRRDIKHAIMWHEGMSPGFRQFWGTYRIRMYPRWIWWWFRDVKVFHEVYIDSRLYSETRGMNVAFGVIAWGKRIVVRHYSTNFEGALLDYSTCWWPWSIIRDYVKRIKRTNAHKYIGKFCVKIPWIGELQLAWFTMEKI